MKIKKGSKVTLEYEGSLEDGTVFDSTEKHGQPMEVTVGEGKLIPGFEKALMGMKPGDEKTFTILPKDAYGQPKPELVKEVPRAMFPTKEQPKAGMVLVMTLPTGQRLQARILKVTKQSLKLDLNHPLAGKKLKFKVKILKVE